MSIRKRTWTTGKGVEKTAWVVDYVDTKGTRRLKTFAKKKDADQFAATASVEVREGVHVADRDTVTVAKAGSFWIATGEGEGLERSTINQRKRHLKYHIEPFIGDVLLSKVDTRAFHEKPACRVCRRAGSSRLGRVFQRRWSAASRAGPIYRQRPQGLPWKRWRNGRHFSFWRSFLAKGNADPTLADLRPIGGKHTDW